jgi:hypothetical protein
MVTKILYRSSRKFSNVRAGYSKVIYSIERVVEPLELGYSVHHYE